MKRLIASVVLLFVFSFAFAAEGDSTVDLVVLFDTSESMFPYFEDVMNYVVSDIVRDFLRYDDTFHLISFSQSTQIEIAQPIRTKDDVKNILSRLLLLYPLGKNTDLVSAIKYLYQYTADLPENSSKVLLVITDGVQDPGKGSPYYGLSPEQVQKEIVDTATRIRSAGWKVYLIKLPLSPKPGSKIAELAPSSPSTKTGTGQAAGAQIDEEFNPLPGSDRLYLEFSKALGTKVIDFSSEKKDLIAKQTLGSPIAIFPERLGKRGYDFSFPLNIENISDKPVFLDLRGVQWNNVDILRKESSLRLSGHSKGSLPVYIELPETLSPGDQSLDLDLQFAGNLRVSPTRATVSINLVRDPFASTIRRAGPVLLFILILLAVMALVVLLITVLKRMPGKAREIVVETTRDAEKEAKIARIEAAESARPASRPQPAAASARPSLSVADHAKPAIATVGAVPETGAVTQVPVVTRPAAASIFARLFSKKAPASPVPATELPGSTKISPAASISSAAAPVPSAVSAKPAPAAKAPGKPLPASVPEPRPAAEAKPAALVPFKAPETQVAPSKPGTAALARAQAAEERRVAMAKRREEAEERRIAVAVSKRPVAVARKATIVIEMKVKEQNPNTGMRNVHIMDSGTRKTFGGGASDFLVFLVKFPSKIGEISFDGERLSFEPLQPRFFPSINGRLEDCLNTTIVAVSAKGYKVEITFRKHVKAVDRMNRMLRCIEYVGPARAED
jgi:hypothetical protein